MEISTNLSDQAIATLMQRLDVLGAISEIENGLTRRCFTPEHKQANELVLSWMIEAGMTAHQDAMGNAVGHYAGQTPEAPTLLIGSHLDTVEMAGKYDGMLGVVAGIALVDHMNKSKVRLPFAIDVYGFCDEEGARFKSTYLGSRAMAGTFDLSLLERKDRDGISLGEAMTAFGLDPAKIETASRTGDDLVGYLELHIEQGPVLEAHDLPVGNVTAISGTTRAVVQLHGQEGHAGTVPMKMRQDPMTATAECLLAFEEIAKARRDVVCTTGMINAFPGSINVIPKSVEFTIDLRAPKDLDRKNAESCILSALDEIAHRRGVSAQYEVVHEAAAIPCSSTMSDVIQSVLRSRYNECINLPSGAGHDAAAAADLTETGVIFLRCDRGISHSPDEQITSADAREGAEVLLQAVLRCQEAIAVSSTDQSVSVS